MAKIVIHIDEVEIEVGNQSARPDDGELSLYADMREGKLCLALDLEGDGRDGVASFQINGLAQVDALRRFCEMAIDQFRSGELGK